MADDQENTPQRRVLVRVIRIGTTVAGALALIAAAWLSLNGYESAGLVGAFPGLVLFVFAIFLLQVAAYVPRDPPPPNS
ncbi:MAG: hypothetical protein AB7J28_16460 [Hyphomonadaceae bacterium]